MRILLASLVIICGINLVVEAYVSYWPKYRDNNYMHQLSDVYDYGDRANYQKWLEELYGRSYDDTWSTLVVPEYDDNEKNAHVDNFNEEDGTAIVNDDDDGDNNVSKYSSDKDNENDGNDELEEKEAKKLLPAILANNGDEHDSGDSENFNGEDGAAIFNDDDDDDDNYDSKDSSDNDIEKDGKELMELLQVILANSDEHDSGDSDTSEKNAHVDNFNEEDGAAIVNDDDDDDYVDNDNKDSSDKDNEKDGNNEQIKIIDDYERNIEKIIQAMLAKDGDEHDSDESDTNETTNSNDYLTDLEHTLLEAIKLEDMYTKQWQEVFKDVNETESTENNENNDALNIDDIDTNDDIAIIVDANENNNETHDVDGNNNEYNVYKYVTFKNDDDNSIEQTNEDKMSSFHFVAKNYDKQNTLQDQENQQKPGSGNAYDDNDSESTETNDSDEHGSDESATNDATNSNDDFISIGKFKVDDETDSKEINANNDAQNSDDIDTNDDFANIGNANENNNDKYDINGNYNPYSVFSFVIKYKNDDDDYQNSNKNNKNSNEIINTKGQQKVWGFKHSVSDNSILQKVYGDNEKHAEILKAAEPQNILSKQISNNIVDYIKIRADLTSLTNNLLQKEESLTNDFFRAIDDEQGVDLKRFEDDVNAVSSTINEIKQRAAELQNMTPKLYANSLLKNLLKTTAIGK